jgi:aspartyl/asparaginyl beta-hydroxylase (cupin superfamily)
VQGDITEENGKHIFMDARELHWAENQSDQDRIILYVEEYKN